MPELWVAAYLPDDDLGRTSSGFSSREEAEKYIIDNFLCEICLKDMENGFVSYEDGIERDVVDSLWDTGCGAEWIVMEEEKYNKCESLEDIFLAAGFEKVWHIDEEGKENESSS